MKKETYKTKSGATQFRPVMSESRARSIVFDGNCEGFCLACGSVQSGVEPDATKYVCEACKAPKVYGFETLFVMNLVKIQ
jgi:hypothetical protein